MKILWVVNFIFPDAAEKLGVTKNLSGGWLLDLSKHISMQEGINLAVVAMYNGKRLLKYEINGICYYLIPGGGKKAMFYSKKLIKHWAVIDSEFNPDVVHLHGTEYVHGKVYLDNFPNRKYLLTIQGILRAISREATANIPWGVKLFSRTLRERFRFSGMLEIQWIFKKNAKNEEKIIRKVNYVTGRTFWDEWIVKSINPNAKYYRCFYNLREEFYEAAKWDISKVDKYTIFAGTSVQQSYKGGHILLKAFNEVLKYFPAAKLTLMLPTDEDGKIIPQNGYQKYIVRLINKYGIRDNLNLIPAQNAKGIISQMQKTHCVVVASSMENASSVLRESMHIGVPCLAAYRGGMTYLIEDGKDGFFYDFPEYSYLSGRICQIFGDDELAERFSKNAIIKAEKWHNRIANKDAYLRIYNNICENNTKSFITGE